MRKPLKGGGGVWTSALLTLLTVSTSSQDLLPQRQVLRSDDNLLNNFAVSSDGSEVYVGATNAIYQVGNDDELVKVQLCWQCDVNLPW